MRQNNGFSLLVRSFFLFHLFQVSHARASDKRTVQSWVRRRCSATHYSLRLNFGQYGSWRLSLHHNRSFLEGRHRNWVWSTSDNCLFNAPGVGSRAEAAPARVSKPFSLRNLLANEATINDDETLCLNIKSEFFRKSTRWNRWSV